MKHLRFAAVAALAGAMAAATPALASAESLNEAMSVDGLQKTTVSGLDLTYVRPGATLAGYDSIQLAPVFVAFVKDWTPTPPPGTRIKVSTATRDTIKQQVASLVRDAFVKELQTKGGFPIVDGSGPNVLLVKLNIINLDITAPVGRSAGRSRTWTRYAGQATLYAELFDSETGQVIARVIDTEAATQATGRADTYEENEIYARAIAQDWAKALVRGLNQARQQMATAAPAAAP